MKAERIAALPLLASVVLVAACNFGRVEQGRVIRYDAAQGTITLLREAQPARAGAMRYFLPPVTVRIPRQPADMGPAPLAGKVLAVNAAENSVLVFDDDTRAVKTIPVAAVHEEKGVLPGDPRVAAVIFPVVNASDRKITVYLGRERKLLTLQVAEEQLRLAADTWAIGDDVRYYYKDPGQALRLMNVTRTDLAKGEH